MNGTLNVVYGSDDNYAKFLGTSMLTMFQSNKDAERIRVFALDCGIQEENRQHLEKIAADYGREITFVPVHEAVESLSLNLGAHKIAVASYARLFLSTLLPEECEKAIYIDCDTLVTDSLAPLWETDMGDAYIAGCQDVVDSYFLDVIHMDRSLKYINAGVLLINLKAWRQEHMQEKFIQIIRDFGGNVPHHDQGTINAACGARRVIVPVRFNVTTSLFSFPARTIRRMYFLEDYYTQEDLDEATSHPAIIHFTTGLLGRPWEKGTEHPYRQAFWDAVNQTPWKGLAEKEDSRYFALKAFAAVYKFMPRRLFECLYRAFSWALHLRK